jgi:predicted DsbA family dithiol-disulfide isomerase
MAIRIDVISDVVCPWCFIGKRHLESALAAWREKHPGRELPQVRWHPFQLNPDLPAAGMARGEYTARKFGGPDRAKEVYARVAAAGARAGIRFDFDRIAVQPNTIDAHRLIHHADASNKQDQMVEALFQAYFLEGADLTRKAALADIARRAGLDREAALAYLDSDSDRELIEREDYRARSIGVEGVPFFIFGQRHALSGAQPPEVMLEVLEKTHDELAAVPQE